MEVVDSMQDAVDHIHKYGSSHTDVIITENGRGGDQMCSYDFLYLARFAFYEACASKGQPCYLCSEYSIITVANELVSLV